MQTFLPLPSFRASVEALDRARLGKQRVEVVQLLRALAGATAGWSNHPAAAMWRGHERALAVYGVAACDAWTARGYLDTRLPVIVDLADRFPASSSATPPWFGDEAFHRAHRSNLRRKDPAHYSPDRLGAAWDVPDDLPYLWPVLDGAGYTLKIITPGRGAKRGKERA